MTTAKKQQGLSLRLKKGERIVLKDGIEISNEQDSSIKVRVFNPNLKKNASGENKEGK